MLVTGLVLAGLAAGIHVYIFALESLWWTSPRGRAAFGTTPQQAEATRELAFNQGFYNLFLAIGTAVGVVGVARDWEPQGTTLVVFGTLFMVGAALVLVIARPRMARAAAIQGVPPLLALATWLIW